MTTISTHNISDPPCFFCNEQTVANHCYQCTSKYDLRDVVTHYDRATFTKPHMFSIELLDRNKNKLYIVTYYAGTDSTQINFVDLADHSDVNWGDLFITSFNGFHITPANIKTRLPLCLMILN